MQTDPNRDSKRFDSATTPDPVVCGGKNPFHPLPSLHGSNGYMDALARKDDEFLYLLRW